MISISEFIFVNDKELRRISGSPVNHSLLEVKDVDGTYNMFIELFPNNLKITYLLSNLKLLLCYEKNIVLKIVRPRHDVLIMFDDVDEVVKFIWKIRTFNPNVVAGIGDNCTADSIRAFGSIIYDFNKLQHFNPNNLKEVALENCYLPYLPEGIGNLMLSSLSLNGSRIDMSDDGQGLLWDWMTKDNISTSLTVLEMNSIGLNKLPFEIIHLKCLETLSVSNNKLTHIPHFIGELPELINLMVDGNSLWFFPENIMGNIFKNIKMSNNRFKYLKLNELQQENVEFTGLRDVPRLSCLTILFLINNCVKFKRQEIPRSLWNIFDFVCRCISCRKLFVFKEGHQRFIYDIPNTEEAIPMERIYWQFFKCCSCKCLMNFQIYN